MEDDQYSEIADILKSYIFTENKEVVTIHEDLTQQMSSMQDKQESLNSNIRKGFVQLRDKMCEIRYELVKQLKISN